MAKKYLISSMRRRRILMRKLNGMVMRPNQDSGECLTEVVQQRDELKHVGESFTEACILDLIREGLSDEYEPIRFATERVPEISLKQIEIAMRNIYANRVARSICSKVQPAIGRESAMMVSSSLKRICSYWNKPGDKKAQCFKFLRESGVRPIPSSGAGRRCRFHNTDLHDNTDCFTQQQQRGNCRGSGYTLGNNKSGNANMAVMAAALTRAEPTQQAQPTEGLPLSSPLPRLLQLLLRLLRLLLRLLELPLRRFRLP